MTDFATEEEFNKKLDQIFQEKAPNFDEKISIALIGKVSAGKSSLLNAFFERKRDNVIAPVGATSGVTTSVKFFRLDDDVIIADCPGLDDIKEENSQETIKFLEDIDIGIFVVTGSADKSQKKNFDTLVSSCKKTFVVLNKSDEWDDHEDDGKEEVFQQWKHTLGIDEIYPTVTKGYDPKTKKDAPMDIRGVDELRTAVIEELKKSKKALRLQRQMQQKDKYAISIILTAAVATAGEAFIPGSAAYITATQAAAIVSLNFLYTGEHLSKTAALAILPTFIGQSLGRSAFLLAKSLLPPTGIIDVAAALVASIMTLAMLIAVKWVLENNHSLGEKGLLAEKYKELSKLFDGLKFEDFKDPARLGAIIFQKYIVK
jgi:small GTP-binding protein